MRTRNHTLSDHSLQPRADRAWFVRTTAVFPVLLFGMLLAWFYLANDWYPASRLAVSGTIENNASFLDVWLNSGQGLNSYEWERFRFQPRPSYDPDLGLTVIVTRTGTRNSASEGNDVILRRIVVDGNTLGKERISRENGVEMRGKSFVFNKDNASLKFTVRPQTSLRLEFPVFNYAGEVDVTIGNQTSRYDLYAGNDETQWGGRHIRAVQSWYVDGSGAFSISTELPRYWIKALRIAPSEGLVLSDVQVKTEFGKTIALSGGEYKGGIIVPVADVDQQRKRSFHPHRLFFQGVMAALCTWILLSLSFFARRFNGLRNIFIDEKRYLFWTMLVGGCGLFFFWQVSFWPGITSNDSLEIWRAAQIPGTYLGDHPPLNVVLYILLSLVWNDVAVVPLFQNFCTALLLAYILFSLFRRGLPLIVLIPCYVGIVCSVPVGLYTVVLWKDVPFALVSTLLAFQLAVMHYEQRHDDRIRLTLKQWFVMFLLSLLLVGFRHNGIVYVIVIPAALFFYRIVRIRLVTVSAVTAVILLAGVIVSIIPGSSRTTSYLIDQTGRYVEQMMAEPLHEHMVKSGEKYLGVFNVRQESMQWDLLHLCMFGRYSYDFLKELGWNDVYPFIPVPDHPVIKKMRGAAWYIYWKSYENPFIYFSWNPVYLLMILPFLPLLPRFFPLSAVFGFTVAVPVAVLVLLNILNWRYYFFAYLALLFLVPLMATDLCGRREKLLPSTADNVN